MTQCFNHDCEEASTILHNFAQYLIMNLDIREVNYSAEVIKTRHCNKILTSCPSINHGHYLECRV